MNDRLWYVIEVLLSLNCTQNVTLNETRRSLSDYIKCVPWYILHIIMSELCVYCSRICTSRQQSLQCDYCNRWQHRICQTGISQTFYRQLVKGLVELENWKCFNCATTPLTPLTPTPDLAASFLEEERPSTPPPVSPMSPEQASPEPLQPLHFNFEDVGPPADGSFHRPASLDERATTWGDVGGKRKILMKSWSRYGRNMRREISLRGNLFQLLHDWQWRWDKICQIGDLYWKCMLFCASYL